jgi:hypothetical protein
MSASVVADWLEMKLGVPSLLAALIWLARDQVGFQLLTLVDDRSLL